MEKNEEEVKREIREETSITEISIKNVAYVFLVKGDEPFEFPTFSEG